MINLYYNEHGKIVDAISNNVDPKIHSLDYIQVEKMIKMCDYVVDTETKQLVHQPQE